MPERNQGFADQLIIWVVCLGLFALALTVIGEAFNSLGYQSTQAENQSQAQEYRIFGLGFQRSDTIAQWVMTVSTVVAAVFLYGTLRVADQTNRSAVAAATAATEANNILRRESRPWLDFSILEWGKAQVMREGEKIIALANFPEMTIENKGKTPATNVYFLTKVYEGSKINDGGLIESVIADLSAGGAIGSKIVFPGEQIIRSKWRDLGAICPTGSGGNTWWFISILFYQSGGEMHFTSKMFSMKVPPIEELIVDENGTEYVALNEIHHISWHDRYN